MHHQCTYQALEGSHQEQERSFPSFCLYEFEESVVDHSHQEGLSQLEPPSVLVYIIRKRPMKRNLLRRFKSLSPAVYSHPSFKRN